MKIGEALEKMRQGKLCARTSFEKRFALSILDGEFRDHDGTYHGIYPLTAQDLLADDWIVVGDAPEQPKAAPKARLLDAKSETIAWQAPRRKPGRPRKNAP